MYRRVTLAVVVAAFAAVTSSATAGTIAENFSFSLSGFTDVVGSQHLVSL